MIQSALLKEFKVRQSNIAGRGLFADSNFDAGERLFPMFSLIKGEGFNQRRDQGLPITWPIDVEWKDLLWHVNHQKSSNCSIEKEEDTWYCTAKENIPSGEELTLNYEELPSFCDRDVSDFIEIE